MRTFRCRAALVAVAALALAGLIVLTGDAGAMQKGGGKKKKTNPGGTTTLTNPQLLQALLDARGLVHMANHDYKGYRGKAAHQIRDAIHILDPKHKHPALPTAKGKEPQAQSDMQLQQAIVILQAVQTQLAGATDTKLAKASTHVGNAIQDLQTALTIK